jgi:deferrochelatase/peroxidase EfeB
MAARAGQLRDDGDNAPAHWDAPFGSGQVHIGVSIFSDSEQAWHQTIAMARRVTAEASESRVQAVLVGLPAL